MTPDPFRSPGSAAGDKRASLVLAGRFLHGLGLALGLVLAGWWITNRSHLPPPAATTTSAASSQAASTPSQAQRPSEVTGPWGQLHIQRIFTEKPAHFIDIQPFLNLRENWLLPGLDLAGAGQWMEKQGIRPEIARNLLQADATEESAGTKIAPSHELIAGLDPEERAKLHSLMAKDERNTYSVDPFRFSDDVLDHLRNDPGFGETAFASLQKLLYKAGMAYCLSDVATFLEPFKEEDTKKQLFKKLTSTESLLVKIVVTPQTDVTSVAQYWSGSSTLKDREVLLSSLRETGNTERLDIIHLLPPVPRKLLYTYPSGGAASHARDCHWTCMNFFEEYSNDDYLDHTLIARELKDNYFDVEQASKPGDIILLTEDGDLILHSCVYLADDVVFTKNGKGGHQPWTLMNLSQVMGFYNNGKDLRLIVKRRK